MSPRTVIARLSALAAPALLLIAAAGLYRDDATAPDVSTTAASVMLIGNSAVVTNLEDAPLEAHGVHVIAQLGTDAPMWYVQARAQLEQAPALEHLVVVASLYHLGSTRPSPTLHPHLRSEEPVLSAKVFSDASPPWWWAIDHRRELLRRDTLLTLMAPVVEPLTALEIQTALKRTQSFDDRQGVALPLTPPTSDPALEATLVPDLLDLLRASGVELIIAEAPLHPKNPHRAYPAFRADLQALAAAEGDVTWLAAPEHPGGDFQDPWHLAAPFRADYTAGFLRELTALGVLE